MFLLTFSISKDLAILKRIDSEREALLAKWIGSGELPCSNGKMPDGQQARAASVPSVNLSLRLSKHVLT